MKHHFVKTENHASLLQAVRYMEQNTSGSARLALVHGEPGVGKTKNIDNWASEVGAVVVKGHVGMSLPGIRWSISNMLGIKTKANSSAEAMAQVIALTHGRQPIIFDEAQFGLSMKSSGVKAAGIEYLRDLAERANTYVLLVCHESEVAGFSESAHIRTRIAYRCTMRNATLADTREFISQLCEVPVDDAVIAHVQHVSGGKFRLLEQAIASLEMIARANGLKRLDADSIKGLPLVIDHEKSLAPRLVARKAVVK